jgi:hypothetical protein
MFKKLIAALLMAPTITYAAGPVDGVYFCNAELSGPLEFYISVHSQSDGRTLFAHLSEKYDPNRMNGYGMGQLAGNTFFGGAYDGGPFDPRPFHMTVDGASLTGYIYIAFIRGPRPMPLACSKVW